MTETLWRMQDRDGRGPYRPGLSAKWADEFGGLLHPPFYEELGWEWWSIPYRMPRGYHCGCACRTKEQLLSWFTPSERAKLGLLGFGIVNIDADLVVAETPTQVVFGCRTPLAKAARTPDGVGRDPRPHPVGSEQRSAIDPSIPQTQTEAEGVER